MSRMSAGTGGNAHHRTGLTNMDCRLCTLASCRIRTPHCSKSNCRCRNAASMALNNSAAHCADVNSRIAAGAACRCDQMAPPPISTCCGRRGSRRTVHTRGSSRSIQGRRGCVRSAGRSIHAPTEVHGALLSRAKGPGLGRTQPRRRPQFLRRRARSQLRVAIRGRPLPTNARPQAPAVPTRRKDQQSTRSWLGVRAHRSPRLEDAYPTQRQLLLQRAPACRQGYCEGIRTVTHVDQKPDGAGRGTDQTEDPGQGSDKTNAGTNEHADAKIANRTSNTSRRCGTSRGRT